FLQVQASQEVLHHGRGANLKGLKSSVSQFDHGSLRQKSKENKDTGIMGRTAAAVGKKEGAKEEGGGKWGQGGGGQRQAAGPCSLLPPLSPVQKNCRRFPFWYTHPRPALRERLSGCLREDLRIICDCFVFLWEFTIGAS